MHFHTTFGCKTLNRSEDIIRVNNDILNLCCDPDLDRPQQSTHSVRHWVTAVHDDVSSTKFDYKGFSGSEGTIRTNIKLNFELLL